MHITKGESVNGEVYTYDIYADIDNSYSTEVWYGDVKLQSTGERVFKTAEYSDEESAINACLDWIDEQSGSSYEWITPER